MIPLLQLIRRWRFKKTLARVLERNIWELEGNAAFDTLALKDTEKMREAIGSEIEKTKKELESLASSTKREDREQRKKLEQTILTLENTTKNVETNIAQGRKQIQSNLQRAADLKQRRNYFLTH